MRGPACGWVVAAVCVLLAALGLALALVLTRESPPGVVKGLLRGFSEL